MVAFWLQKVIKSKKIDLPSYKRNKLILDILFRSKDVEKLEYEITYPDGYIMRLFILTGRREQRK